MTDDIDIDTTGWTSEQIEEYRVEQLTSPLFDLWLRFEKAFARVALDRINLSDEDAEAAARQMTCDSESAAAWRYLLRSIKGERMMRGFAAKWTAVQEAGLGSECMSFAEVEGQYAKLNRGDA